MKMETINGRQCKCSIGAGGAPCVSRKLCDERRACYEAGNKWCPFGCIFNGERLLGDCRVPWSKDCVLNK